MSSKLSGTASKGAKPIQPEKYLFPHSNKNEPISRVQAFRIIKKVAAYYNIPGVICCHSLRKTFGYHAWQQGVQPAMLVSIYNHSSYEVTKRYLGIEQDDRDKIFRRSYSEHKGNTISSLLHYDQYFQNTANYKEIIDSRRNGYAEIIGER